MRSDDSFSAEQLPFTQFDVISADAARKLPGTLPGTVRIEGRLTARDTTRPIALSAEVAADGADSATLTTRFTVDHADFGLSWNQSRMLRGFATVTATSRFTRLAA
ncbi:YceI family protein [Actinospica robiniae]|uniref:YceI family protein n=1 Tax=Actinospica robiniae TaxID=304901 RepID=UPI00146FA097|nr:YceI family protein [Actinospica robiniae]